MNFVWNKAINSKSNLNRLSSLISQRGSLIGRPLKTSPKMDKLCPPESVRGMKQLDRKKFDVTANVPTLEFCNADTSSVIKFIKRYLLKLENFKPVQSAEDGKSKSLLAYMNPTLVKSWRDLDQSAIDNLSTVGVAEKDFKFRDLVVTYDNWKSEEIFRAVLPSDRDNLTGFSVVGHIIHVNLRDHHLEYKNLIGEVLIDKVKLCRTVVNKTNQIDNTYRNFEMEVVCGDDDLIACVRENKCRFEFDFSKVYWNSRLCTEHERIVNLLEPGDVLFDVFAGVGPFAIPAAKKHLVFANDLNPDSFEWLNHNAKINKIKDTLKTYNLDGKEFIEQIFSKFLSKDYAQFGRYLAKDSKIHVTMNLPALALTFLNTFIGLLKNCADDSICSTPITVHVYFFTNDISKEACQKAVSENIGFDVTEEIISISFVRNVAPSKDMMRVSFNLPYKILLGLGCEKRKTEGKDENEPLEKICPL